MSCSADAMADGPAGSGRESARPNVLFVVVDDLRCELGCYGREHVLSPNIDALAARGLRLDRAYCQQAICAPSRASVLSGCRPDTTGIYGLRIPLREAMPDVLTLPEHFRTNGYETVSVGKVYHHANDDLQGWSQPPIQSKGDWKGRGYLTDEAIEEVNAYNAMAEAKGLDRRGLGPAWECADVDDEGYHDGKDASAAVAELQRLAGSEKPFFLAVGFHKPHLPFCAPKKYWDLYDRDALPNPANPHAPEGAPKWALTNFGELRGYTNMPAEGPVSEQDARALIHGYCACVSYMDAQLGRVMDELDRQGLRDNTVVVFWGEHGSWSKHTNFEIDTRAPLIVADPRRRGSAGGAASEALTEFVDIYPTLCELCGLEVPDHCEGTSMAPLLERPDRPWKPAAFSQYPRPEIMGYTMRTHRYRYTEWLSEKDGRVLGRELYDHQADPLENVNAAEQAANAELLNELAAQLRAGWQAARPA